uniref:Cell cycle control protein 50A n=1 Tax=Spumella elongata TaxID=89044 RepID=A0A7S3H6C7_9STRA|mmetsp:Transcript_37047/g.63999  ORF Transcript_37047/g.63999 Transcript_37047/m.63999 type:complete len:364 (+) Transcript_37047:133-1224(+)|eukprot:CAMPEP_0185013768 /NCGR_PEP_ID=MMETSP1098-20130426/98972_1 /TAXON_ID=89044 /ORGANISM="Spumella elongata, Strain CCAP 955/1" /LENGTH=363 /DNA_ID=CAMNT_0027542835 /DNA_START=116 /DNA_END=1207 /DNA_ORIENTATION=+
MEQPVQSNRPPSDDFRQQKLKAWQPIMTPLKVVAIFVAIGVAFIPTGVSLMNSSNAIYEKRIMYDGSNQAVSCSISDQNEGKVCSLTFNFDEDADGPIYVYYELENFYQNHRRYVSSRDSLQLAGEAISKADLQTTCESFINNGSQLINPCGLIANSLFTDVFTLDNAASNPSTVSMDSSEIAWASDKEKFKQPQGFQSKVVTSTANTCAQEGLPDDCKYYQDPATGTQYYFHYPNDNTVQYLYESYPNHISPVVGVTDQHFKVWMRPAALPQFRKLYGKIDHDYKKGDTLTFTVTANFEVESFDGSKSLLISNLGEFGGKNPFLGVAYVVVGSISLMFALLFVVKQTVAPRAKADASLLNWT